jgi:hypothetical protein
MILVTPLEVASGSSGCESRQSNFTAESEGQAYAGPLLKLDCRIGYDLGDPAQDLTGDALQKADEANRDHLCSVLRHWK